MAVCHKRRNSEKRKEKSRDAARCRRGKESEIFSELASLLPLAPSTIDALDKASVMRLFLSTLKIHTCMEERSKLEYPLEGSLEEKLDFLYPKALDGFLCILSKDGDFIYMSESVIKLLGLSQIDLIGQSIYDFAHPCDHEEIEEALSPHADGNEILLPKTLFIRLKCTLLSRGRSVNLKSATYKVIKLTGKYVPDKSCMKVSSDVCITDDGTDDEDDSDNETRVRIFRSQPLPHFIAICEAIPHPSNIEVPLDRRTFTSRHSMNMKFTDCDDRIKCLIGYQNDEVIGHSFFVYHHAIDSEMMEKAFKHLFCKGQISTNQYRFLARNGGYVWMVTEATVIYSNKSQKPECVVCVHYVLSHVEQHGRILANIQISKAAAIKEESKAIAPCQIVSLPKVLKRNDLKVSPLYHDLTFSTKKVFGKKTKEMEQEFYFPPGLEKMENYRSPLNLFDDYIKFEENTKLKADVPLSVLTQIDVRDNRAFPSSEKSSLDSTMMDSLSPMSYLTTIKPSDISAMDTIFTTMDPSCDINNQEIDFSLRAPYIPMNGDEDFILGQPYIDGLLNTGTDFNPGIYGSTDSIFGLTDKYDESPCPENKSKMDINMLGGSTLRASIEQPQNKTTLKMKHPFNRSCLDTEPPAKLTKYQTQVQLQHSPDVDKGPIKSVLLNLLFKGEDKDHGYTLKPNKTKLKDNASSFLLQNLLTSVKQNNMDVNAPVQNGELLHGCNLMKDLDCNNK